MQDPETNPLVVDATIQRFEFSVELFWKTLRRLLVAEGEGVDAATSRETLKHAYRVGWIDDEAGWLAMLQDSELTSHVSNDEMARQIFRRAAGHYHAMRTVFEDLKGRIGQIILNLPQMHCVAPTGPSRLCYAERLRATEIGRAPIPRPLSLSS